MSSLGIAKRIRISQTSHSTNGISLPTNGMTPEKLPLGDGPAPARGGLMQEWESVMRGSEGFAQLRIKSVDSSCRFNTDFPFRVW